MAIPFYLPTNQETEENYELFDQFLEQLFEIVRQIILRRRRRRVVENPSTPLPVTQPRNTETQRRDASNDGGNTAGNAEPSVIQNQQQAMNSNAMPLPDVIPTTDNTSASSQASIPHLRRGIPSGGVEPRPPSPRRARRRISSCCDCMTSVVPADHSTCQNWQRIGKQLRRISDNFRASDLQAEDSQIAQPLHNTEKEEGLLSRLLPSPLGGYIWTAVIFLVGWRFLAKKG